MSKKKDPRVNELADAVSRLTEKYNHFILKISFEEAVELIATVQLALRHPGNVGPTSKNMREFIEGLISALEVVEPKIGPILRHGFDPSHDVKTGGKNGHQEQSRKV